MKLLVAYGSKHGSTQEVAGAIAERLREGGREVELRCAADVEDLTPYDGVVLGGANTATERGSTSGAFCSALSSCARDSARSSGFSSLGAQRKDRHRQFRQVPPVLRQESNCVFVPAPGGVIEPAKLRFPLNRMPASDARDWDAINAWADEAAATLSPARLVHLRS